MCFDFRYAAYTQRLRSRYLSLPEDLRMLRLRIAAAVADGSEAYSQRPGDLSVHATKDEEPILSSYSERELAIASRVLYFIGHWNYCDQLTLFWPGAYRTFSWEDDGIDHYADDPHATARSYVEALGSYGITKDDCHLAASYLDPDRDSDKQGASWRLSRMIDKHLVSRLDIATRRKSFEVREGVLTRCYSSRSEYASYSLGFATQELLQSVTGLQRGDAEHYVAILARSDEDVRSLLLNHYARPVLRSWRETYEVSAECLSTAIADSLWPELEPLGVISHSWNPHPFVITPKHLRDGTVDVEAGPCGYEGCRLSYASHVCEKSLAVGVIQPLTRERMTELLQAAIAKVDEFCDKYAYPKPTGVAFPYFAPGVREQCAFFDAGKPAAEADVG